MGNKSLIMMLKTHIDSISVIHGNMLRVLASLRDSFFNYVLSSLVLILKYVFRFPVEDRKIEYHVQFEDYRIDEVAEKLTNLLFPSGGDFCVAAEEREDEAECSVLSEANAVNVSKESRSGEVEETEGSVLIETDYEFQEDGKESEGEADYSALKEEDPDIHEGNNESGGYMEGDSNVHQDGRKTQEEEEEEEEEEETEGSLFVEEPSTLAFSFLHFYADPNFSCVSSDNAISSRGNIGNSEISEGILAQEEEESVQELRTPSSNSHVDDCLLHNDGTVAYQIPKSNYDCEEGFEAEGLKMNKEGRVEETEEAHVSCDDRQVSHVFVHEDTEKEGSNHEHEEETTWEENLDESDYEEGEDEDEDDLEWDDDDYDDDDDEDDELVQQMKLELRIAKQGGLATILEEEEEEKGETESPNVVEDLKPTPIKIEEKLEYKDHMIEIQKFYKSYAEKMRKLDILNYQTMNAIGLLQLKETPKLILVPKSNVHGAKPLIPQNLWPRKAPKHTSDPILKFVHELHRDLELVYVGHVCLSWEILCWQLKKAKELQQYDSPWPRRYNQVAGDFQLFQVLIQRFLENEPFQGPRIQNYVKNRCVVRNLLHIPAIKDDNKKDKKISKWGEEEDAIASGRLVEIIKESMQVFWNFVRAERDYGNVIPKVSKKIGNDDADDPEISDLLVDIKSQLQKKEKKLKDIVRSGSCIVRRFKKHHHEDQVQLNHEQLLAQVGLRLVSRVVNMKRLRKDQLLWCNEKLNRINFVGRKIQVEPSFLLFPC